MFARQQREALGDPATRRQLMDDYLAETEGEKKQQALLVLSMLHTQDVLDFASALARSTDGARRRDGFALLARLGLKLPEVRRLARDALRSEQDPAVIAQAIGALQPALVERSESEAVAAQLRGFVDDRDAGVRARAIDAFAAWDQSGASAEVLDRGVLDRSPDVRWAAITAVGKFRARSEALKQSLIALAYDANEQSDLRLAAARALEHFPLDPDEVERLVRAAIDADRAAYPEAANRFDDRPRG